MHGLQCLGTGTRGAHRVCGGGYRRANLAERSRASTVCFSVHPETNQEIEDYSFKLIGGRIELQIVQDISGGGAYASLAEMRLA